MSVSLQIKPDLLAQIHKVHEFYLHGEIASSYAGIFDISDIVSVCQEDIPCALKKSLSSSDHRYSESYVRQKDRVRRLASRYLLRTHIADLFQIDKHNIEFQTDKLGKPFGLIQSGYKVHCSMSYSECKLGIAISNLDIGIDIEAVRPSQMYSSLVHTQFTEDERVWFDQIPASEQAYAFTTLWVRKEALLKAMGVGLSNGLDAYSVLGDAPIDGVWKLKMFPDIQGFAAAIAWA